MQTQNEIKKPTVTNPESKPNPVERAIRMMAKSLRADLNRGVKYLSSEDRECALRATKLIIKGDQGGRFASQWLPFHLPRWSRAHDKARLIADELELYYPGPQSLLLYETASFCAGLSTDRLRAYYNEKRLQRHKRSDGFMGYDADELEALLRDIYKGDATGCDSLLFEPKSPWKVAADSIGAPQSLFKELIKHGWLFDIHGVLLERDVSKLRRLRHRHADFALTSGRKVHTFGASQMHA